MSNSMQSGILTVLLFSFSPHMSADVSISTDSTAPTGPVVASYDSPLTTATMSLRVNEPDPDPLPDRTLGQSFTSTINGSFDSITLKHGSRSSNNFSGLSAGEGDMILAIWNVDTNTSLGTFTYDVAGQNYSNTSGGTGGGFITFDLDTEIAVTSGVEYAFELAWDPTYITDDTIYRNFVVERDNVNNGYADGGQISRINYTSIPDLATNGSGGNNDLEFYVNATIPEPQTYALFVGVLALLGASLRRR